MALVIDLAPTLDERRRMLDQVDQAIADIRRLFAPPKQKRRRRQLRLPLLEPKQKPSRAAVPNVKKIRA